MMDALDKLGDFRWVPVRELGELLASLPEDVFVYQSPVTSGLVVCRPIEGGYEMIGIVQWYGDGSVKFDDWSPAAVTLNDSESQP